MIDFYKAILMFLAYTPIEQIKKETQQQLAVDLSISAIISEEIYNFGEVISSPVLVVLKNTEYQWLYELILALNEGNLSKFNEIMSKTTDKTLLSNQENIKQKVILLSIMNLVFKKPSHDRNIPFSELAAATNLPMNEIEWILMKALSLKLIKGLINELEQSIQVTWVLPRVLNCGEVDMINTQLHAWTDKVKSTLVLVEDQASEL